MQTATDHRLTDGVLTLRPVSKEDVTDRYFAWLNDPEVYRWLETRWYPQNVASIREYLSKTYAEGAFLFAICTADGGHIGNIKLGMWNQHHRCADIAYFIGERSQWGRGHATRAVKMVAQFAFYDLKLHRVQAGCYGGNKASQRVLRKAGFAFEGQRHRALKTANGWDDEWHFGRVAEGNILG